MMSKQSFLRTAAVLVLAVPVVYLAVQLLPVLFRGYEVETAVQSTLADAVSTKGVVVRDEVPISDASTVRSYLVADGTRVSAGASVERVFSDSTQAENAARADRLSSELAMLTQSQSQSLAGGGDIDTLLKQQQDGLFSLLRVVDSGNYTGLAAAKTAATLAVNRLQVATGTAVDFSARIAALTEQRDAATAAAGEAVYLSAPAPGGYFSSMTDGLEQTLTPQALDAMDAAQIAALADAPGGEMKDSAGKLVNGYEWYYYCVVDDASAKRFIADGGTISVEIDFDYTGAQQIPATVVGVERASDGGPAKVKLKCDYTNADTINLRAGTAQISFKRYEGVRIAQSAVHIVTMEDGTQQRGVYVKYGNIVEFKKIYPIFETAQYVVVPAKVQLGSDDASLKNEVLLYDEIIVSGKNLYAGKLL